MDDPNFQREVLERLIVLETLIKQQDYKTLNQKVETQHDELLKDEQMIKNHEERLSKIEDNNKWLWRLVIGSLITGAMAILFKI
jgi:hypothetical protein